MDITTIPTARLPRQCGSIPCGQCEPCLRRAMLKLAIYAQKEEDPKGVLLELLAELGLPSGV